MSTKKSEDRRELVEVTSEDYANLTYIYNAAIKSGVSDEVITEAFDIAHEGITRFSLENFAAALDIKLKLDMSVTKFYKR